MNKKVIAAVSAMAMAVQTFAALTVSAEDDIKISAVLDGARAEITLSGTLETDVTVYAASYEGSVLTAVSVGSISAGESAVTLENVSEGAKVYVWDRNQTPVCDPVTVTVKPGESEQTTEPAAEQTTEPAGEQETEPAAEQTTEPAGEQETEPAAEQTTEPAGEQSTEEPYTAEFTIDGGHASVDVYYTQDYTRADEETVETALARNSATGEIDTSGSGQINFKVCIDEGFEIVSVDAAPAENFNQIKAQGDNIYRVTKVTGDIVITVKTKETEAEADEPISVFDFNTVTSINGVNTSGAAPAEISASEDGTAETVLTLNTVDYITTAGDLSYAAVLAPVTGWGDNPYVQVKLSAAGYSDLAVSAAVGATKKGPAEYKLQYSTNGEIFTDAGEAYTLAGNKTLYQAFDKVTLADADDAETLYIRIVPVGTATVGGEVELGGTSGEYAVNNIKIYGTANGNPTAVPAETEEPEATETAETEEPAGDGIIHLNETSIDAEGVAGAAVSGTTLTISSGGEYTIEGTLTDGQIITNAIDPITLNLAGVNVTSSTADALSSSNGIVTIATAAGTENTFTSAAGSAIESSKDLTIKGDGTLNAISETGNGIRCKADLEIGAGDINVTAYNNGIKGDNSVKITKKATNITVTAQTGDAVKSDAISTDKTTGESSIETGKGTVTINGGTLDLTAPGNDGIQADSTLTIAGGAITINAGANGIKANEYNIPEVDDAGAELGTVINGAVAISGGTLDITSAEEAIRAAEKLDITGGETTLTVTGDAQDAVKAGKNTDTTEGTTTTTTVDVKGIINISDGTLTVLKSTDDAIVSMGDVNITGGTVKGGTSTNDVTGDFFKVYDNFVMSGGTLDIMAYCDGIQSGKALTVTVSGTTETESNYTAGNVDISGGTINIRTYTGAPSSWSGSDGNSNTVSFSCKGIKANTDLNISGGDIAVNTYDDAIHSNWAVTITGGKFDLTTGDDGVHADYLLTLGTEDGSLDDFDLTINGCYEGLEGSVIYQWSGTMSVTAYDDGMNAAGSYQEGAQMQTSSSDMTVMAGTGSSTFGPGGNWGGGTGEQGPGGASGSYGTLYINGGYLYINNTNGDGIDANGTITINGGIAIVDGATMSSEDGLDFDSSVTLNGGYVLTMTSGGMDGISGSYPQKYLLYGFSSSGGFGGPGGSTSGGSITAGNYAIVDASGNVLCAFSRTKSSIGRITFTSPDLVSGGTYSIKPLTVNGASAVKSLYGTIDENTLAFTLADGCSVNTSGTSYTMTLY